MPVTTLARSSDLSRSFKLDPYVSVVLPSYRGGELARATVARLQKFLDEDVNGGWEIVIVDDGAGDFPEQHWSTVRNTRVIRFTRNQGKGAALAAGLLAARGDYRLFTDVDLPYGTGPLSAILHHLRSGMFHVVIGDRNLPGSRYHEVQTPARRLLSRAASAVIGTMVTGGFFDTQCGVKGLRGDVADLILPMMHIKRFAFDVELLYIALLHRLDIKRVPVELCRNETSSVRPSHDALVGALDLVRVKAYRHRGAYANPTLTELCRRESVLPAGSLLAQDPATVG